MGSTGMGSKKKRGVNLIQYRKVGDRWQFAPVAQKNGLPGPRFVRIEEKLARSKGGTFCLDYRDETGQRRRLSVSAKPDIGFIPKSYEERPLPVPRKLIEQLREYRRTSGTSLLVFPTDPHPLRGFAGGKPNGDFLALCKEIAFRAGLNCGRCEGTYTVYFMRDGVSRKERRPYCCAESPHYRKWYLHKFRHTYATKLVQDGCGHPQHADYAWPQGHCHDGEVFVISDNQISRSTTN